MTKTNKTIALLALLAAIKENYSHSLDERTLRSANITYHDRGEEGVEICAEGAFEISATVIIQNDDTGSTIGTALCVRMYRPAGYTAFAFPHSWHHTWLTHEEIEAEEQRLAI